MWSRIEVILLLLLLFVYNAFTPNLPPTGGRGGVVVGDGREPAQLRFVTDPLRTDAVGHRAGVWAGEVSAGGEGILHGVPEGVIFIVRSGNPADSAMYFAAWGGMTNACSFCRKIGEDNGEFGEGFSCGAAKACLYYAGPERGLSVRATAGHGFIVYVLKNHSS